MALKNEGPIVAHLERSVVKIEKARLTGPQTDINVNGSLALDTQSPLNFSVDAQTNLALLRDFSREIYSSGSVMVNTTVRGTFADPTA